MGARPTSARTRELEEELVRLMDTPPPQHFCRWCGEKINTGFRSMICRWSPEYLHEPRTSTWERQ